MFAARLNVIGEHDYVVSIPENVNHAAVIWPWAALNGYDGTGRNLYGDAAQYPKLCDWVEGNIEETLTFYRLPRQHHKHLKSTNMLERLNEELRRRTRVVRIFPNVASCMRLIRALCVETHEGWLEDKRYINMDLLREARKDQLRKAA